MVTDADELEYLTIESVQWATGYKRPRMSEDERRARHRATQRNFMLRERERMEGLRATVRRLNLTVLLLEAMQEAARLSQENLSMLCQPQPTLAGFQPSSFSADESQDSKADHIG